MNENANYQGSVVGKAVANTMGIGVGVALTGAGLLMGRGAFKGIGRGIKNIATDTSNSIKSMYRRKVDGGLLPLPKSGEILKTRPSNVADDTRTFVRTARNGARSGASIKVDGGNRVG